MAVASRWITVAPLLGFVSVAGAAAQTSAPSVEDQAVVSLSRQNAASKVVTTIWLDGRAAAGNPAPISFEIKTQPTRGELTCKEPAAAGRARACVYQPDVDFVGHDQFTFVAVQGAAASRLATVAIDVRSRGIRWELQAGASTGLTSDGGDPSKLPDIVGGSAQDLMFTLAWQAARPRRDPAQPGGPTRTANMLVRTGFSALPVTAEVTQVTAKAGVGSTSTTSAVTQRAFVAEGEFNWNAASAVDGGGTFVEVGALGKAAFDAVIEGTDTLQQAAGQVVQVIRAERGTSRFEGGMRAVIKQYREGDTNTYVVPDDKGKPGKDIVRPSNFDDLLVFELTVQRNNALAGLTDQTGLSENRWAMRFMAYPEVPYVPGRIRFMMGLEVTQALSGGPKAVRFLYGGAFGLGKMKP